MRESADVTEHLYPPKAHDVMAFYVNEGFEREKKLSGGIESSQSTLFIAVLPNANKSVHEQRIPAVSSNALQQKHHRLHYFNALHFNFNVSVILLAFNPRMLLVFQLCRAKSLKHLYLTLQMYVCVYYYNKNNLSQSWGPGHFFPLQVSCTL